MSKFKVGDVVKRVVNLHPNSPHKSYRGEPVTISSIDPLLSDAEIYLHFSDCPGFCNEDYFELVPKPSRYYCYVPGNSGPRQIHSTLEEAKAEAERLARHTQRKVQVLSIVAEVEVGPAPVIWS